MLAEQDARRRVGGSAAPQGRRRGSGARSYRDSGGLATLKADASRWLTGPEYEALRLEIAHAAAEAAVVDAKRQVRLDQRR